MGGIQGIVHIEDAVVVHVHHSDLLLEHNHIALVGYGDVKFHIALGGLIVGIGLATDGADAVGISMAGGCDYLTLFGTATDVTDSVAGVAVLGAGSILLAGDGAIGMIAILQLFQQGGAVFPGSFLADDQIVIVHITIFRGYFNADGHGLVGIHKVDSISTMSAIFSCNIQAAVFGNFVFIFTGCIIH